jgi:hypothetical protein
MNMAMTFVVISSLVCAFIIAFLDGTHADVDDIENRKADGAKRACSAEDAKNALSAKYGPRQVSSRDDVG